MTITWGSHCEIGGEVLEQTALTVSSPTGEETHFPCATGDSAWWSHAEGQLPFGGRRLEDNQVAKDGSLLFCREC